MRRVSEYVLWQYARINNIKGSRWHENSENSGKQTELNANSPPSHLSLELCIQPRASLHRTDIHHVLICQK